MADNPKVNRYLDDKAFDRIDHALGRPLFPMLESYRNYFATEAGGELAQGFDQSPFWAKYAQFDDMAYYRVTDEGRSALFGHLSDHDRHSAFTIGYRGFLRVLPALTAGKAKYAAFLDIRDIDPDLTFIEFAAPATVRRGIHG